MAESRVRAIPENVKEDLVALAILQSRLHETRDAIRVRRSRVNAKMPGAARLVGDDTLIRMLIRQHNTRAAKVES